MRSASGSGVGGRVERAPAAVVGGERRRARRAGRDRGGGAGDGDLGGDDPPRDARARAGRVARAGPGAPPGAAGRKPLSEIDPTLLEDLERLVDADTRGDPESPLCVDGQERAARSPGGCASSATRLSHETVARFLRALGYSLQANRKTREGIAAIPTATRSSATSTRPSSAQLEAGPAGDLGRHQEEGAGRRLQERRARMAPQGRPGAGPRPRLQRQSSWARRSPTASTTSPTMRAGSTSASTTTPRSFAVASIRSWWEQLGKPRYPHATTPDDHRRLRRLQRQPHPAVEDRAAAPGRRDRPRDRRSATSRPARASGTRSSTACSASSSRTGAASRSSRSETIISLIGATTTTRRPRGPRPPRPGAPTREASRSQTPNWPRST